MEKPHPLAPIAVFIFVFVNKDLKFIQPSKSEDRAVEGSVNIEEFWRDLESSAETSTNNNHVWQFFLVVFFPPASIDRIKRNSRKYIMLINSFRFAMSSHPILTLYRVRKTTSLFPCRLKAWETDNYPKWRLIERSTQPRSKTTFTFQDGSFEKKRNIFTHMFINTRK